MKPEIGKKHLITTDQWFIAPDGETYKAVFGTVKGILSSDESLGIRTNAKSTNWYVSIGNMLIAGCQIHYVIQCDNVSLEPPTVEIDHEGKRNVERCGSTRIYIADA
jgi:hypothetical protein